MHFFATVPAGGRLDTIRLARTRANGHPALAAYLPDNSARCRGYGIMVFAIAGDGIATIAGFPSPDLFDRFGLPPPATDISLRGLLPAWCAEAGPVSRLGWRVGRDGAAGPRAVRDSAVRAGSRSSSPPGGRSLGLR
jgi:hypothetical protein